MFTHIDSLRSIIEYQQNRQSVLRIGREFDYS